MRSASLAQTPDTEAAEQATRTRGAATAYYHVSSYYYVYTYSSMRTHTAALKLGRGAALLRRTRPHTAIYESSY